MSYTHVMRYHEGRFQHGIVLHAEPEKVYLDFDGTPDFDDKVLASLQSIIYPSREELWKVWSR